MQLRPYVPHIAAVLLKRAGSYAGSDRCAEPFGIAGPAPSSGSADHAQLHIAVKGSSFSHAVCLKHPSARPAEAIAVLLEALPDGIIAIRQLVSAKARRIARAGILLFGCAPLRLRHAASQNQRGNCDEKNSAHAHPPRCLLLSDNVLRVNVVPHDRSGNKPASSPSPARQLAIRRSLV